MMTNEQIDKFMDDMDAKIDVMAALAGYEFQGIMLLMAGAQLRMLSEIAKRLAQEPAR